MVHIDFRTLISRAGSEDGARVLFQRMIASLIRIKFKDAREIRPCPGDWGIDVIVGELTGVSMVWQAKYFIDGVGDVQKKQIRGSFKTLMTKAEENTFTLELWTLCLPCNLSTDETKWWEGWKKKNEKKYNVKIKLMDETAIRSELETPDAQHIARHYFGPDTSIIRKVLEELKEQPERALECLPDQVMYEEALFIKKLKAGGASEIYSAKTAFFNAELLTQEVFDKGDSVEINSIQNLKLKLRSMWETRFNKLSTDKSSKFKNLYPGLMKDIEQQDTASLRSPEISATFLHKQGMVHQMANKCQVGWAKNFRDEFGEG